MLDVQVNLVHVAKDLESLFAALPVRVLSSVSEYVYFVYLKKRF